MPIYEHNGIKLKFDQEPTDQELEQAFSNESTPSEPSKLESFALGTGQGLTSNFGDELYGGAVSGLKTASNLLTGKQTDMVGDYRNARDDARAEIEKAHTANPKSFLAGEFTGGAGQMAVPGLGEMGVAKLAALGGLQGFGASNADLTQGNVGGAVKDTATGAVIGGALSQVGKLGKLAKTGLSSVTGKSEGALGALFNNSKLLESPSIEQLAEQKIPQVADKFKTVMDGLSSEANKVLSTSQYLNDGAIPKDDILKKVISARRSLGGVYTDETRMAANTLDRITEDFGKLRNTVSQDNLHSVLKKIDSEIPWQKVWKAPETLTATDNALIDLRNGMDSLLKNSNPEYAKIMKPLSETIQNRNEFLKKFSVDRIKGQNGTQFVPSDATYGKLNSSLNEGKLGTDRVLRNAFDTTGENLQPQIQNAKFAQEFQNETLPFTPSGMNITGEWGITKGMNVARGATNIAKTASDAVINAIGVNPKSLGKYAPVLQKALQGGTQNLAVTHWTLQNTDPEYNEMVHKLADQNK